MEVKREGDVFNEVKLKEAELAKENEKRSGVLNYSHVRKERHSLPINCK